jgi:hypothetical protein
MNKDMDICFRMQGGGAVTTYRFVMMASMGKIEHTSVLASEVWHCTIKQISCHGEACHPAGTCVILVQLYLHGSEVGLCCLQPTLCAVSILLVCRALQTAQKAQSASCLHSAALCRSAHAHRLLLRSVVDRIR